jgi:tetratricopeptide (TPR) repeat protein
MARLRIGDPAWERRIAELWATFDEREPADFLTEMRALVGSTPLDHPAALFELASAHDSLGQEREAEPLYRAALEGGGLDSYRRRRAAIQLASTLRNLGKAGEAEELLRIERGEPPDELDDAVAAFLALALADAGKPREALSVALAALAPHLTRYNRSLASYALALMAP